ncbi:MAG: SEL1-like repeat protein [Chthoniobacterales bacterium]|nr:SEL1-like repeat protein [Chthoniobacterales bacterium]
MTDEQVVHLIDRHLGEGEKSPALVGSLRAYAKLWEWAHNPLHLKMLTELANPTGKLPSTEGQLVQLFVRRLFRREKIQRQQTNDIAKERLLAALAFETRSEGQTSFTVNEALRILRSSRDKIGSLVDLTVFINEVVDNHILVRSPDDAVSFSHELYQDYFAGVEIKEREEVEPMFIETLQADLRWEESLILYSGLSGNRANFFSRISSVNPRLARRALGSAVANDPEVQEVVRQSATGESSPEHLLILAEFGDVNAVGEAIGLLRTYDERYIELFIEILSRAGRPKPLNEWEQTEQVDWYSIASVTIEALIQNQAGAALGQVASRLWPKARDIQLARRCFEAAIDLGDLKAVAEYGAHLISGTKIDADVSRGVALISSAAEAGFPPAMIDLSDLKFGGLHSPQNVREGEDWLRRAAELGNAVAMRALGQRLLEGDGVQKDSAEGHEWLAKAAAIGHLPAMRDYGVRLLEGEGVRKDQQAGERWLRQAAANGDEFAKWELGYRLLDGGGVRQDTEEGIRILTECSSKGGPLNLQFAWLGAFDNYPEFKNRKVGPRWLMKAANAGLRKAMCILGERYYGGDGIPRDYKKAAFWLKRAAEAGDASAMNSYATMLLDGDHEAAYPEEGEYWLRKAAQQEFKWAIPDLAERLITGNGLRQNFDEGADWLCKSLEIPVFQGPAETFFLPPGSTIMNWIRALFVGDDLPKRPDLAERLLRKAAQGGWSWPMMELGDRLIRGDGIARDRDEGVEWLLKAAATGDALSMYRYGCLRLESDLIPGDTEEGTLWLERSAQKGFPEAMTELGSRLIYGVGMNPNPTLGLKWLREAVAKDHPRAIGELGRCIFFGNGTPKDEEQGLLLAIKASEAGDLVAKTFAALVVLEREDFTITSREDAMRWLREAAEGGDAKAALNLGFRLLLGNGLPENPEEALAWIRRAAEAGDEVAQRLLREHE